MRCRQRREDRGGKAQADGQTDRLMGREFVYCIKYLVASIVHSGCTAPRERATVKWVVAH